MTKVLHIFRAIEFSGAEIMFRDAAEIMLENNIELYALDTGKEKGSFGNELRKSGYQVKWLPFKKNISHFLNYYYLLRRVQPDVVHIHKEQAFLIYGIISKLSGCNVIRTFHSDFTREGLKYVKYYIQRQLGKLFNFRMVSISDSIYSIEEERYRNKTLKIFNWYNDNKYYPIRKFESENSIRNNIGVPNKNIILSVGSCLEIKNHSDIIKALSHLKKEYGKEPFYIHIGEGELLEKEKRMVFRNKLDNNVLFLSNINKMRKYYLACDLFIMPSSYEGLGISGIEAMACGCKIIFYNAPGLNNLIKKNDAGYLIEQNWTILAKRIYSILYKDNYSSGKIRKAINRVKNKYSMQGNAKKYIRIYKSNNN